MSRTWLSALAVVVLGALAVATTEIDTDARAVLGEAGAISRSLDTTDGRMQVMAIRGSSDDLQAKAVSEVNELLHSHPLVKTVSTGPAVPSSEMLDLLWRYRLVLAPPSQGAFTSTALDDELKSARRSLSRLEDAALAKYFLRDPTGSFRRVIRQISELPQPATDANGHWLAKDGITNLLFVELANVPFNAETQAALDADVQAVAAGVDVLILGPRSTTARVSGEIAQRSQLFGGLATVFLLGWLIVITRSPAATIACLVPLGAGIAVSVLAVGGIFGGVHVIALGFGATLLGLSMDYPLHLMSHNQSDHSRRRAMRLILLGAVTTAVTFLALAGAGVAVLAQMGVLVAVGLIISAVTASWLAPVMPRFERGLRWSREFNLQLPRKLYVLTGTCIFAGLVLLTTAEVRKDPLITLPADVTETIAIFRGLVDLPSATVRIEVAAPSLHELADRMRDLSPILASLGTEGAIGRYQMLTTVFPEVGIYDSLPDSEVLAARLAPAIQAADFSPDFAPRIIESYQEALSQRRSSPEAMRSLTEQSAISSMIGIADGLIVAPVRLDGVLDSDLVVRQISAASLAGVTIIDTRAQIGAALGDLKDRALLSLALGVVSGLLLLALLIRQGPPVGAIAISCAAAALSAAVISSVMFGGFSVTQIVALALIVGIGIDYGMFIELSRSRDEAEAAARSVTLCALTTLIAFGTLSFSGVSVLEEISLTVSAGIMIMLGISLIRSTDSPKERM